MAQIAPGNAGMTCCRPPEGRNVAKLRQIAELAAFLLLKLIDPAEARLLGSTKVTLCAHLCAFVALAELRAPVFAPFLDIGELRTCRGAG